ncbi:MAG: glycoside hydrolase family 2 [Lentisphaerae bacterium]|nr:glycoside hydrolase family 2 [Lentisphaerota bacterium]
MSLAVSAYAAFAASALPERAVVKADGAWEMAQSIAPDKWMPAVVPGTVLRTLVKNGVVPDPHWGWNNRWEDRNIPDLSDSRDFYTAAFRTKVLLPSDFAGRTVWMRPEGINYRSEIYLNGKLVTSTCGMFARNTVDVSGIARPGEENDLLVKVWPVDHPGVPKEKRWGAANGEWHNGGDGEIGRNVTMLMSAGWDFTFSDGVRDRNTGIWRDIVFFATGDVRLDAPYVRTRLAPDHASAELALELDVHNAAFRLGLAKKRGRIVAEVEGTDVRFEADVELYRGERRTVFAAAKMPNPRLWWPRNKGDQSLYVLRARFLDDRGSTLDEVRTRFGIREFASDQGGKDGARQFYANGRKIFVRGVNWIPDAMLACDDARMERTMRLVSESGVNLVRLWGGGIVESDRFYELCDEYGLMVWQEFWMTGDTRHPDDPGLYLDNVAQSVKRIRSHAAMCHWVASNESTETSGTEELVKRLTGTTSWMQQSECDGVHDGSPYGPVNPMRHYEDTASPRGPRLCGFNPEYGTGVLPSAEHIRSFVPEDAVWPISANVANWKYREGGGFYEMTTTHHALVMAYGDAKTLDGYCKRSEAADYMQQRAIWDCWNRARNEATGVLYWYENPPVPEIVVHGWDYDLSQTSAFFAQKRANAPLHVMYEYLSNTVAVCSDLYGEREFGVVAEVYDFDSRKVWERKSSVRMPGECSVDAFRIPAEALALDRPHFIKVRLFDGDEEVDSGLYWRSCDAYMGAKTMTGPCTSGFETLADLPPTEVVLGVVSSSATKDVVRVANAGRKIAFLVHIAPKGVSGKGVHYSDNWFSLLPGESAEVVAEHPEGEYAWSATWNLK